MNGRAYATPVAMERAIGDRAKQQAAREADAYEPRLGERERRDFIGRRISQLRRDVGFHAIVQRLQCVDDGACWVIKGGVALQLRLDPSRPSKDIDVVNTAIDLEQHVVVSMLRRALDIDMVDFFHFEVDDTVVASAAADRAVELRVDVYLGARRYERFTIDLAPPRVDVEFEVLPAAAPPLGIEQLGSSPVRVLRIEQQLADKVCAMHERREAMPSTRWRDLADVAMIAQQVHVDAARFHACIRAEVPRRSQTLRAGLPSQITLTDDQRRQWTRAWGTGGRIVPIEIDEALESARRLVDPILGADLHEGVWDHVAQSWCVT